jgi:hypothetical protein
VAGAYICRQPKWWAQTTRSLCRQKKTLLMPQRIYYRRLFIINAAINMGDALQMGLPQSRGFNVYC